MATKKTTTEPEYTAEEFTANSYAVFNEKPDIVATALRLAKVTKTTKTAAQKIVKEFKERKVN